ncbi:hypothetical protein Tco_0374807 [Tanacetum coccineum]
MNLDNYEEPRVLVTCRSRLGRQMELLGDETEIVPLYYHIVDKFQIQFGREEFFLVNGLRFEVEYWADYNNEDDPILFRRRVFSSAKDGAQATPSYGHNMATPNWQTPMPSHPGTSNWQSQMPSHLATPNWQPPIPSHPYDGAVVRDGGNVVVAWSGDVDVVDVCVVLVEMRMCGGSVVGVAWDGWLQWVVVRGFSGNMVGRRRRILERDSVCVDMKVGPVRQANKGPIIVGQHSGISDLSGFQSMQGGPSSFSTANISFFEGAQATPSYGHNMATPNWQTPMSSHIGTSNWQSQMPSHLAIPNWQPPIPSHPYDVGLLNPEILKLFTIMLL